jgi:photosystem II stability/assembly factor-like uncharacterized protein
MRRAVLAHGLLVAVVAASCFGVLHLSEATTPSASGYWTALAAAEDGVYLADESRGALVRIYPDGSSVTLGLLPWQVRGAIFRSVSVRDQDVLLGADSGLFVSHDLGRSWLFAIPDRRITVVGTKGEFWVAGAWNDTLYVSHDRAVTWTAAIVPTGDNQFLDVTCCWVATLLGVLATSDGGSTWRPLPGLPSRITAVSEGRAADWAGEIFDRSGETWVRSARLPAAVRSIDADLAGTIEGLYFRRRLVGDPIGGREVTKVISSGGFYYAALARGPIYVSHDGTSWSFLYQP